MPTPTTHYGFPKPTIGGDGDIWGAELNQALDDIDTVIFGIVSPSASGPFNVLFYGAKGDGIHNDIAAIRLAFAAAMLVRGTVVFPPGQYLVDEQIAAQILLITTSVSVSGYGATLLIKSTVPNTVDVLHFASTSQIRDFRWSGLSILPQSGTPARYCLHVDTTNGSVSNGCFADMLFGTFGDFSFHNTRPDSFIGHEFYITDFYNCVFTGGVDCTKIGDSIHFYGGNWSGTRGFILDATFVSGDTAHGFLADGVNVTCRDGIIVYGGNLAQFNRLNMEATQNTTQATRSMIYLAGKVGQPLYGVSITNGFIGGGALIAGVSTVDTIIRHGYCVDAHIENNNLGAPSPDSGAHKRVTYYEAGASANYARNIATSYGILLDDYNEDHGSGNVVDWIAPGVTLNQQAHYLSHKSSSSNTVIFEHGADQTAASLMAAWLQNDPKPPTTALAGAGAGNVDNGGHYYRVSYMISGVEQAGGTISNLAFVADKTTNGKVSLVAIPLGPAGTTARLIYRGKANAGISAFFLLATIADNVTTTYTDNTADSGLGVAYQYGRPNAGTTTGNALLKGIMRIFGNGNMVFGDGADSGAPFQFNGFMFLVNGLLSLADIAVGNAGHFAGRDSANATIQLLSFLADNVCRVGAQQVSAGGGELLMYVNGTEKARLSSTGLKAVGGVSAYGVAPPAQQSAITSPTAPSAAYVQAEAVSMKTAVDALINLAHLKGDTA